MFRSLRPRQTRDRVAREMCGSGLSLRGLMMPPRDQPSMWKGLKRMVRGVAHSTCQDWCDFDVTGTDVVVAAVADGHGGDKYFRSHVGAQLAVKAAIESSQQLLANSTADLRQLRGLVQNDLPHEIVKAWRAKVRDDMQREPFTSNEEGKLAAGERSLEAQLVPYGSTLLLALVSSHFIAYLQLGDGDILAVGTDQTVIRPIQRDPTLIANETTSLASTWPDRRTGRLVHEPWRLMKTHFHELGTEGEPPLLIMLSSDGYSNSFRDNSAFEQVATDILTALRSHGHEWVDSALDGWLQETSVHGSGDDISVALLHRRDATGPDAASRDKEDTAPPGGSNEVM